MDDDRILEYLMDIKTKIAEMSANLTNIQTIIQNHENRINHLERNKPSNQTSYKDTLILWLTKGIIIALTSISVLVGAGGMISKILGA